MNSRVWSAFNLWPLKWCTVELSPLALFWRALDSMEVCLASPSESALHLLLVLSLTQSASASWTPSH